MTTATDESGVSVRERVHELIQDAISSGQPLKLIREHLRDMGVRFCYSRTPPGPREKARRLKQHSLCASGCGRYADWKLNELCFDCRAEAWR